jgi:hypothetical protein
MPISTDLRSNDVTFFPQELAEPHPTRAEPGQQSIEARNAGKVARLGDGTGAEETIMLRTAFFTASLLIAAPAIAQNAPPPPKAAPAEPSPQLTPVEPVPQIAPVDPAPQVDPARPVPQEDQSKPAKTRQAKPRPPVPQ